MNELAQWMSWWSRMVSLSSTSVAGGPGLSANAETELVVDEPSACLQGICREGLPSDHFQLNRFMDPEDPCYIAVKNQILQMFTEKSADLKRAAIRKCCLSMRYFSLTDTLRDSL